MSPATATVDIGDTVSLTATSTDSTETMAWMSSDEDVATVDDMGTVTGVAVGTAFVTAMGGTTGATGFSIVTVERGTAVSFADDLLPLFTRRDVWYAGSGACNARGCHTGVGGAHDLDMGSYAAIMAGTDGGTEAIVVPMNSEESMLRARLRDNRMPWGISVLVPRDGPSVMSVRDMLGWSDTSSATDENGIVKLVEAWIDDMAPDGAFSYTDSGGATVMKDFDTDILPLFTTAEVWAPDTQACNSAGCHNGTGGAHDLDMGSYAAIMAGTDGGTEAIIEPGDAEASMLRERLRNNRMPWGMPTTVPRDGPNGEVRLLTQWIDDGAMDN